MMHIKFLNIVSAQQMVAEMYRAAWMYDTSCHDHYFTHRAHIRYFGTPIRQAGFMMPFLDCDMENH